MKKLFGLLLAVSLLTIPAVIDAQQIKYGYISSSRLLSIMPESSAAESQMRSEVQKVEQELQQLEGEYQNKLQKYVEEQDILTNVVRQNRERELMELQNRIQSFQAEAQDDLQRRRMELIQPIFEKIESVIAEVARERGYSLVFDMDGNSMLYLNEDESEDMLPFIREKLGL